jgi:hypothetical protein
MKLRACVVSGCKRGEWEKDKTDPDLLLLKCTRCGSTLITARNHKKEEQPDGTNAGDLQSQPT